MKAEKTKYEKTTFAGGCFWCMESAFENIAGVINVVSGYSGGHAENPTYEEVSSGLTGHAEAVQLTFDPTVVSYSKLLAVYWNQIDPTDSGGSFADRGSQYRSIIFYHNEKQKIAAENSKKELEESGIYTKPIATELVPFSKFWPAEGYHQDFYKKNPLRYELYKKGSGRKDYIEKMKRRQFHIKTNLNRPPEDELRQALTPLQYKVTQEGGTERPFDNEFWNNKQEGIYVDIVSGEPLFSSLDKFDSGTGWPSFVKPLEPDSVTERGDYSLLMERTEVRSKIADSHLGHVFKDGPQPTGLRYCINSASLRFIPRKDLEKEGYGRYKQLFECER